MAKTLFVDLAVARNIILESENDGTLTQAEELELENRIIDIYHTLGRNAGYTDGSELHTRCIEIPDIEIDLDQYDWYGDDIKKNIEACLYDWVHEYLYQYFDMTNIYLEHADFDIKISL